MTNLIFADDYLSSEITENLTTLAADSSIHYRWHNDDWELSRKHIFHHDEFGQVTEDSRYVLSIDTWFNDIRNVMSYDTQNKLVQWLNQEGYLFIWQNSWLDQYEYDGYDALITKTRQIDDSDSWQLLERINYYYNEDSTLSEEIIQANVVGNWLNDYHRTYTYLPDGQVASILGQTWDYDGGVWLNDSLTSCSYTDGNLSQLLTQTWADDVWNNEHHKALTYDPDDHLIEETLRSWFGRQWFEIERQVHEIDLSGNVMITRYQDWDYDEANWFDRDRLLFQYDEYGKLVESLSQYPDSETNTWINEYLSIWYYPTTSAVDAFQARQFSLSQNFPNPFNPSTSIRFDIPEYSAVNLTIYDALGREIITLFAGAKPAGSYEMSWQGLDQEGHSVSTGVYFCRFQVLDSGTGGVGDFNQTIKMLYLK
ncbi:MAG: T9SS type A sorting domain-containing protein [Candidatus Marinimicrobia bacterium]|nr:T9SS type A sorting domain-containing protein [Candidatus Neomarinimicrobiota bacterium]